MGIDIIDEIRINFAENCEHPDILINRSFVNKTLIIIINLGKMRAASAKKNNKICKSHIFYIEILYYLINFLLIASAGWKSRKNILEPINLKFLKFCQDVELSRKVCELIV